MELRVKYSESRRFLGEMCVKTRAGGRGERDAPAGTGYRICSGWSKILVWSACGHWERALYIYIHTEASSWQMRICGVYRITRRRGNSPQPPPMAAPRAVHPLIAISGSSSVDQLRRLLLNCHEMVRKWNHDVTAGDRVRRGEVEEDPGSPGPRPRSFVSRQIAG